MLFVVGIPVFIALTLHTHFVNKTSYQPRISYVLSPLSLSCASNFFCFVFCLCSFLSAVAFLFAFRFVVESAVTHNELKIFRRSSTNAQLRAHNGKLQGLIWKADPLWRPSPPSPPPTHTPLTRQQGHPLHNNHIPARSSTREFFWPLCALLSSGLLYYYFL